MKKEEKKVPQLRFPKFKGDWEQRKVSEMFKVTRGYVLPATDTSQEMTDEMPYPVYSSQTKDNGLMGYYSDYLYEDAITWTTDGANAGTVNFRAGKFYCTNVCGVLLSDKIEANKVIAEALNNVAKRYVSYVGNPKLMNNVMADIQIAVPISKRERDQISSFFSYLDHLITLHQRKLEKIRELKKGMLQKMFPKNGKKVPEIRFKGFTDDWEQRKVTELLKSSSSAMKIGPFGSALKKEYFVEEGIKVYAQENAFTGDFSMGDYYITEDKYKELKSCELYPGDLVISMMGTVGACAIFPKNAEKGIMNSHLLRLQFNNEVIPEYIMYLLRDSVLIRKQIDRLSVGSIMSGLSSSVVKKLVFPIPKLAEQKRIVEYLGSIDHLITLHQRKLEKIKELKKGLLQQMFV